jgi:hypothetical protein
MCNAAMHERASGWHSLFWFAAARTIDDGVLLCCLSAAKLTCMQLLPVCRHKLRLQ